MRYSYNGNDYGNKVIDGTPCIWLQYFGWAAAKPAKDFTPGEKFLWNNGTPSIFKRVIKETDKTLTVVEEYEGKEYERKLLKNRLVAIGK